MYSKFRNLEIQVKRGVVYCLYPNLEMFSILECVLCIYDTRNIKENDRVIYSQIKYKNIIMWVILGLLGGFLSYSDFLGIYGDR